MLRIQLLVNELGLLQTFLLAQLVQLTDSLWGADRSAALSLCRVAHGHDKALGRAAVRRAIGARLLLEAPC